MANSPLILYWWFRLVSVVLPRVRDFEGISGKAFDGRGNYSMGIKEQLIFPEIEYDKIDKRTLSQWQGRM